MIIRDQARLTTRKSEIKLHIIKFYGDNTYLLGFVTTIHHEGRQNFRNQRTDVHKELYTVPVD